MKHGASVVTANKALLAQDGPTLYAAAQDAGVDLYYEAAVAGAIPLLRPLRESLAGDDVRRVLGIVNGTTNYVLDKMDSTGASFHDAVEQAQALGYAEADPTADVEGFDAAAKAAILASLAFHTRVSGADVHREGITEVTAADVAARQGDGLASSSCWPSASAPTRASRVRVHPAMIPRSHPLAGVREAFNAVFVEADAAGQLMFYGRGAGGDPTASAVLGDVGRRRPAPDRRGPRTGGARLRRPADPADGPGPDEVPHQPRRGGPPGRPRGGGLGLRRPRGVDRDRPPADRPGHRRGGGRGRANLVIVTHAAPDAALSATVEALAASRVVRAVVSVMRVEGVLTWLTSGAA